MYEDIKYLTVPADWNNASVKQQELLDLLNDGYWVVSSTGAGELVHYVVAKNKAEKELRIVNKGGRPKKVAE